MSSAQSKTQGGIRPSSVVYWSRFLLAVCGGFAIRYLGISEAAFGDFAMIMGVGIGILFYALSLFVVRKIFHYGEAQLKGKNKDATIGIGTYIMVFVMVTVLLYTAL